MRLQPTASKSEIFINCQFPFDPALDIPPEEGQRERANYGLAFHEGMALHIVEGPKKFSKNPKFWKTLAEKFNGDDFRIDPKELREHVQASFDVLWRWLKRNPWGVDFTKGAIKVERSVALSTGDGWTARECKPPSADAHVYPGLKEREIAGTIDLSIDTPRFLLVEDHKTSVVEDFSEPAENAQLQTLALAGSEIEEKAPENVIVAALHADRIGLPVVYADEIVPAKLYEHKQKLDRAFDRIGDGSLKPGPWCKYCPARSLCPAADSELLANSTALVKSANGIVAARVATAEMTLGDVGRLSQLIRQFEKLAAVAKPRIKELVRQHGSGAIQQPDGKLLMLKEKVVERLSKGTLERGLGRLKATREIDRLRKMGGLETATQEELHADDGY